jgi:hypothetical protein
LLREFVKKTSLNTFWFLKSGSTWHDNQSKLTTIFVTNQSFDKTNYKKEEAHEQTQRVVAMNDLRLLSPSIISDGNEIE